MATPAELSVRGSAQPAWRQRTGAFWRWWTGELSAFAREKLGHLMRAARAPFVAIEGDALVLYERRGTGLQEISRLQLAGLDAEGRRKALGELLARAGEDRRRVRLILSRGEALLRRVSLPAATEENLGQVLAFEMDRLTPFSPEDVYFDHRVAGRDAAGEKIDVDVAVARRDLVDARAAELGESGASVQGVVLADDAARHDRPLDLLPEARRGDRDSAHEMQFARQVLIGAVVVLTFIAFVLPIWQKRETVLALLPVLAKARQDAEATDALAKELEKLTADWNFLLTRKYSNPPALAFLEEISRLLPDHTWVQQLDMRTSGRTREVQIAGETTSSSKLIEILEQSSLVQNAAPRGTVTRGAIPGTERFLIAAEAKSAPLPERQLASALPTPVPAAPPVVPPPQSGDVAMPGAPSRAPDEAKPGDVRPAEVRPVERKPPPAKPAPPRPAPSHPAAK